MHAHCAFHALGAYCSSETRRVSLYRRGCRLVPEPDESMQAGALSQRAIFGQCSSLTSPLRTLASSQATSVGYHCSGQHAAHQKAPAQKVCSREFLAAYMQTHKHQLGVNTQATLDIPARRTKCHMVGQTVVLGWRPMAVHIVQVLALPIGRNREFGDGASASSAHAALQCSAVAAAMLTCMASDTVSLVQTRGKLPSRLRIGAGEHESPCFILNRL